MNARVPFSEMIATFGRIGLMSFGGPAAQIGLMHQHLVDDKAWLEEKEFLGALSFCMLLPGPEAMQLATFCGWKLRGTLGGLIAGLLFVLPGAMVIFGLVWVYALFGTTPLLSAAFLGVKATVVAIILQALVRLSGKILTSWPNRLIAIASFATLLSGILPFPAVIGLAAAIGMFLKNDAPPAASPASPTEASHTIRTILIWATLWLTPVALLFSMDAPFLQDVAVFFSKLAVVTFGGAYAVLAYMVQTVVQDFGWLSTDQMMDALGLAETTPGPLILVTQFVATFAGLQQGGPLLGLAAGFTALWCTFAPCFLWIFAGAPHVERILAAPRLASALSGISAAVVGVIANLGLWFTVTLLFAETIETSFGPIPKLTSLDTTAAALTLLALLLMFAAKRSLLFTLALCALAGLGIGLL
ncbi:chromate efflux transporter [Shimia haliotis]|uniref:Chromate transporter n=1 Tax=Shimia haliotis TaxID=1280847 RepID=A0A1I4AUL8_9RHOB|nr:chromate efflux transporter [Shimia haliotis]SFK60135.1 chromate transporter [Shimia haliotis]